MKTPFRQGIVQYPQDLGLQAFLSKTGQYVSLRTESPVVVTIAHKTADYLITETTDVPNAWGPLPANTTCWLYWDINPQTAVRTFGFTVVPPVVATSAPSHQEDLHWFNTTTTTMYVSQSGKWREVIRVFACRVIDSTFASFAVGYPTTPYAGSQVEVYTQGNAGHIIVDDAGLPLITSTGTFITTESPFFFNGSPINPVRLEATVVTGQAKSNLAKHQVVYFPEFGKIDYASYNNAQSGVIAMLMDDLVLGEVGTVCIQGKITNPQWNWPTVGAPLWITTGGALSTVDPHVVDPITYPVGKPPVARVIAPDTIIFDQGLGGKGDRGDSGQGADVGLASGSVAGIVRLSAQPVDLQDPVAVGDNDIRLSNKVLRAGDVMTGPLILSGSPTQPLGAATKSYVDSAIASAADSTTLTNHINNQSIHLTTGQASSIALLTGATSNIQQQLDALAALVSSPDQGATSITVQGDGAGYWQTTPLNPSSALITLALSNVGTAGNYNYVTTDSKGRVTGGSLRSYWDLSQTATTTQPLSLNYTPTTALHAVNKQYVDSAISGGLPAVGTAGSYVAVTTDAQGRVTSGLTSISVSGDLTGSINAAASTTLSLPIVNTAGTYRSVTTDSKGRVTGGTNPTTLAGYGITDAVNIAGSTMTGFLTLSGDPTQNLHAATKKYVDDNIANATTGGNVHNGLLGLQGGTTNQYYHLTEAQHIALTAVASTYVSNGNSILSSANTNNLSALGTGTGLPYVRSGVVSVSATQIIPNSLSQTIQFGTATFTDNVGAGQPVSVPKVGIVLDGTSSTPAVVFEGYQQTDPYGQVAAVNTLPVLRFKYGSNIVQTVTALANGTMQFSGIVAADSISATSSISAPSLNITSSSSLASVSATSLTATAGSVINAPTAGTHITNKTYVDTAINTALSGAATHNTLTGLQGGASGEYYHLTASQVSTVNTIAPFVSVIARRDVNNNFTASQSFGNLRVQAVGTPTSGTDATTKDYVDTAITNTTTSLRTARVFTATASGALTIDWSLYDEARITLTGNISLTFSGALDGQRCMLKIKQDGVGSRTVTLPGTVRYSVDAASYTASTTAGVFDRVGFIYDSSDARYDLIAVSKGYV